MVPIPSFAKEGSKSLERMGAWALTDHVIGRFESGRRADFCILADDPLEFDPKELKDIPVRGTIFAGEPNPAN